MLVYIEGDKKRLACTIHKHLSETSLLHRPSNYRTDTTYKLLKHFFDENVNIVYQISQNSLVNLCFT